MAVDRSYEVTRSVCPVCRRLVQARLVGREGRILMQSHCPDHGTTEALVSSDEAYYLDSLACSRPAARPRGFARSVDRGCPDDCGFCSDHEQHVCMPVIEITDRCDLSCPICLVDNRASYEMPFETLESIVSNLLAAEDSIQVLNLSGGEPTLHPEYRRFLEYLVGIDRILRVSVSTNGLALAKSDELRALHKALDVVISLQLDGFSPATYERLRGQARLAEVKRELLDRIVAEQLPASLTVTLARGVNEGELAKILDFYLAHDNFLSLTIQPFTQEGQGRGFDHDPLKRLTIPDVIALLIEAAGGVLRPDDFGPLPCSHPACFCQTFLLKVEGGGWLPLKRLIQPSDYVDLIRNRSYMSPEGDNVERLKGMIYNLWTGPRAEEPQRDGALKTIKKIFRDIDTAGRPTPKRTVRIVERRKKSIFIHQFMDAHTFDLSRVRRCCSVYPRADGGLYPMCAYNVLRRCSGTPSA